MNSKPEQSDAESWEPCPQGELSRMVHRMHSDQSQASNTPKFALSLAAAVLVAIAAVGIKGFWGSESEPMLYGGISCGQCKENFEAYHKHLTKTEVLADAQVLESMRVHLSKCKLCKNYFNKIYPGSLVSDSFTDRPGVMLALFPQFSVPGEVSIR